MVLVVCLHEVLVAGPGRVDALVCSTQGTGCYIYARSIETRPSINKLSVAHT